jgi:hypothetical protein
MMRLSGKIIAVCAMLLFPTTQAMAGNEGSAPTAESIQSAFGERCHLVKQCGDLSYIDCGSMTDGPAYYVRTATLDVVMNCGGYCMAPKEEMKDKNCAQCPPEQWTCKD